MKVCGCINLLVAPMSILFRSVLFVGGLGWSENGVWYFGSGPFCEAGGSYVQVKLSWFPAVFAQVH